MCIQQRSSSELATLTDVIEAYRTVRLCTSRTSAGQPVRTTVPVNAIVRPNSESLVSSVHQTPQPFRRCCCWSAAVGACCGQLHSRFGQAPSLSFFHWFWMRVWVCVYGASRLLFSRFSQSITLTELWVIASNVATLPELDEGSITMLSSYLLEELSKSTNLLVKAKSSLGHPCTWHVASLLVGRPTCIAVGGLRFYRDSFFPSFFVTYRPSSLNETQPKPDKC